MCRTICGWFLGLIIISALALFPSICRGEKQKYINQNYGISFPLPEDTRLYTPENPGPFTFEKGTLFCLVNRWKLSEFIMVNLSTMTDEKALADLKSGLESRGLRQPKYRQISLQYTSIGENQQKKALEHIFDLQGQVPRTMRQVYFVHKGQGLAFCCTTSTDRFHDANRVFFERVFRSIKFE